MRFGCERTDEPVAHGMIADVGHLFKGDVADAGQHHQLRLRKSTLQLARGVQADGTVAVSPDEQGGLGGKPGERAAEETHIHKPALNDLHHVFYGSGKMQALGVTFERVRGDPRWVSIHAAERGGLQHPGQERNAAGKPESEGRLIEADQLVSEIAERICRSEENEPADTLGVPCGEHHRYGAAVGVAGDIGLLDAEGVHEGGETVGCCFKARVQPGNTLGLAHVEVIDGVYIAMAGEEVDVATPVSCRADEAVQQQERTPGACALVVDLRSLDQDKSLFNVGKSFCHKSQPPQKSSCGESVTLR